MYVPGCGGCSSIIHLCAKYPKSVLAIGIVALSGYLFSNADRTNTCPDPKVQEITVLKSTAKIEQDIKVAEVAFREVEHVRLSNDGIRRVLDLYHCTRLSPDDVRKDSALARNIGLLYFLDLCHEVGIEEAKILYLNQK
jgi:hypothetical protein